MTRRLALLLPAALAMLAGLDGALLLLGLPAPVSTSRLADSHGMLLVLGFVGTVIALERAVALRRPAGFLAPACLGLGAILVLSPAPGRIGGSLLLAGTLALIGVYIPLWRRQREDAVLIQVLGAVLAAGGALLWLGGVGMPQVLPWLTAFVVLTIAGERLELARVALIGSGAGRWMTGLSVVVLVAVVASLLWPPLGFGLLGAALLAMVAWLWVHDVARRTVSGTGLPRFIAACLLAGYAWLAVAGGIWLLVASPGEGAAYDAVIHAVFLGFTISMIMAHAPVILPAVLRVRLPYHPVMIAPAVLLHVSLLVRLGLGDARGSEPARQVGGVGNIVALLAFAVITVVLIVRSRSAAPSAVARPALEAVS